MNNDEAHLTIQVYITEAEAYRSQGETATAIALFGEAAKEAAQIGWPEKQLEALYNMGTLLQEVGAKRRDKAQMGEAIAALQKGLEIASQLGEQNSRGVLLISLGFACANAERDIEAIDYFKAAIRLGLDNLEFETAYSALSTLGILLSNLNRSAEAVPYYEKALEMARRQPEERAAEAETLANLSVAYEKSGRIPDAITALQAHRKILYEVGDVRVKNADRMIKELKSQL